MFALRPILIVSYVGVILGLVQVVGWGHHPGYIVHYHRAARRRGNYRPKEIKSDKFLFLLLLTSCCYC